MLAVLASLPHARASSTSVVPGLYVVHTAGTGSIERDRTICVRATTREAFQAETAARVSRMPQFRTVCRLAAPQPTPDGFALAMDCGAVRSITIFRFAADRIEEITRSAVEQRADRSSEMKTVWHRVATCE